MKMLKLLPQELEMIKSKIVIQQENDVIFKWFIGIPFGDPAKYPEEILPVILLRFSAHAAGSDTRHIGFDLDMHKFRAFHIAAEDIRVWRITQSDNR